MHLNQLDGFQRMKFIDKKTTLKDISNSILRLSVNSF